MLCTLLQPTFQNIATSCNKYLIKYCKYQIKHCAHGNYDCTVLQPTDAPLHQMCKTLQQISANIQLRLLNMKNKIAPLHPTIKNIATSYNK
jgi:hypothetical protein